MVLRKRKWLIRQGIIKILYDWSQTDSCNSFLLGRWNIVEAIKTFSIFLMVRHTVDSLTPKSAQCEIQSDIHSNINCSVLSIRMA
jgi:hypothetical protein